MIKGVTRIVLTLLVAAGACLAGPGEIHLQFMFSLEDGLENTAPDTFSAIGSPEASVGYDIKDLLDPPSPPGKYVRIYSSDAGVELIRDYRPYDPNLPDISIPIELLAYDVNDIGLTGTTRLDLMNPSAMAGIPGDTLVYLRRYDAGGSFLEYYDLRNTDNHSVEWQATEAMGVFASLELVVVDKCLAADIDDSGRVDLRDFAVLARHWLGYAPASTRDVDGDRFVGLGDLEVFAEKWLCDCDAEK